MSYTGIQYTPVASIATLMTPHATSQSARRTRSPVKVRKDCTGQGSRSGGTATKCSADPQSMPATLGLMRSRTDDDDDAYQDDDDGCSSDAPPHGTEHPETGRRRGEHSPKRAHVRVIARVTNDVAVTPRATLHNGLTAPVAGRPQVPDARQILRRTWYPLAKELPVSDRMCREPIAWAAT